MNSFKSKEKMQKANVCKVKSKNAKGKICGLIFTFYFCVLTLTLCVAGVSAQSTEFTYKGRLLDNSLPPTPNYDLQFSLWDSLVSGTQAGTTQTVTGVAVANGIFTVRLNFGTQFTGAARFIQIEVRLAGGGAYTTLAPRQPITSSPYSIKSATSTSADGPFVAGNLCVTDAQINGVSGSKVTGTVANATTAVNVSGIVPIANGGTGSSTKNFVDLSTNQNIFGNKTFNGAFTVAGSSNTLSLDGSLNVGFNVTADQFFGGADGLIGIRDYNIADNAITTPKIADASVTASKLAPGSGRGIDSTLLATLRWDILASPKTFAVGTSPSGVAFDGANIWVTNLSSINVTKLPVFP